MSEIVTLPMQVVPALTVAQIKNEIVQEAGRYQAGVATRRPDVQFQQQNVPAAPNPVLHLPWPALLDLSGPAFADAAYSTILNRAADAVGTAHLVQEIANGTSKVLLLGRLQGSAEGRISGSVLPGLRRRYMVQRLYRVPLLGLVVRLVAFGLRRGGWSKVLGGKVRLTAAQEQAALQARFDTVQAASERRDRSQDTAISAVSRHLVQLQTAFDDTLGVTGGNVTMAHVLERLAHQEQATASLRAKIDAQGDVFGGWEARHLRLGRRMADLEDSNIESLLAMSGLLDQHAIRLAQVEAGLTGRAARVDAAGRLASAEGLDGQLARIEALATKNQADMAEQERRIGILQTALRDSLHAIPAALQVEDEHAVDRLYVDFEDRFRGSRADIKERLRFYLPILAESDAGSSERPVLDVGCGRGEFLELLAEAKLTARGVDANTAMAASCQERGLTCFAGDALAYLALQPAGSLGAVTGFHIIEHLPFTTMVRLFDAAFLALAPGGVVVFETPNPANLLVASRWFYLDPTHRNPLPGEMVAMIAEARGFTRVSIVPLHPMDQHFGGEPGVLRDELDALFHGPQDYALLARKP